MSELDALLDQIFGRHGEHAGTGVEGSAWATLTQTGLTRVGIPEHLGGSGGELTDAVTVTVKAAEAGRARRWPKHFSRWRIWPSSPGSPFPTEWSR
ncbi:hypothetical protein [Amycolatopsis sp. cmx-4-68]|uniref:hypothetical protein n=1 Tax=Amycolatopsis sp. cmx-4-68 TaxID=2790938 RepID=UPI003977E51E